MSRPEEIIAAGQRQYQLLPDVPRSSFFGMLLYPDLFLQGKVADFCDLLSKQRLYLTSAIRVHLTADLVREWRKNELVPVSKQFKLFRNELETAGPCVYVLGNSYRGGDGIEDLERAKRGKDGAEGLRASLGVGTSRFKLFHSADSLVEFERELGLLDLVGYLLPSGFPFSSSCSIESWTRSIEDLHASQRDALIAFEGSMRRTLGQGVISRQEASSTAEGAYGGECDGAHYHLDPDEVFSRIERLFRSGETLTRWETLQLLSRLSK